MNPVMRMLRALTLLANRRSWGPFVEAAEISGFDHGFTISWSQGGEDLALLSVFANKTKGTYLDIGAHHPTRFSVTRHLYQLGWNGVNVEANSLLMKKFYEDRTRDINLSCAVGEKDQYEFTVFKESAISTVNEEWKKRFTSENNEVDRTERIPGRRLRSIYDEFFGGMAVDLLTIDAEGADFEILQSMDFDTLPLARFPEYVQVESAPPVSASLKSQPVDLLIGFGYQLYMVLPYSSILKRNKL